MPHRHRSRRSLLLLGLSFGTANLAIGLIYPLLPVVLTERAGLSIREFGLLFAIASVAGGIAFPLWGLIADGRLGRPRTLSLALGLIGLLGALTLGGPAVVIPLAVLAFVVAESGLAPVLDALALDALHGRTSLYGRLRSAGSLGYAIAAIAATPILAFAGFAALGLTVTALALVGAVVAFTLPARRVEPGTRPHLRDLFSLPRRAPIFGRLVVIAIIGALPLAALIVWFGPLLRERGFDPALAGVAAGLTALVEIPVLLAAARLGERTGWRAPLVAGAAVYVAPIVLLALPLGLPVEAFVAIRAASGVGFGLFMTGAVVMVRELVPAPLVATGQGLLQLAIFGLAPAIVGLFGGLLWPMFGPYSLLVFGIAGACSALIAFVVLPVGKTIHHDRGDRGIEPAVFEPPA